MFLLFLFCASDMIKPQEVKKADTYASLCATARCKPMGVETVSYFDGSVRPLPEVKKPAPTKKTTVKTEKKKQVKKTQSKKA